MACATQLLVAGTDARQSRGRQFEFGCTGQKMRCTLDQPRLDQSLNRILAQLRSETHGNLGEMPRIPFGELPLGKRLTTEWAGIRVFGHGRRIPGAMRDACSIAIMPAMTPSVLASGTHV
jgi:hypothetical protein